MSGLPFLPGYTFNDSTICRYHLSHTFDIRNGYNIPKNSVAAIGKKERDVDSVGYLGNNDPVRFDPSLTYGRTRSIAASQFLPHYVFYDQKCLTFRAFYKQSVNESPNEFYRVRQVNIIYFLEDDSITVMEPKVENSGLYQGRTIRRGRIPKTKSGDCWHWKDLNVGVDVAFNGIVFHTVDCDLYTKEFMRSQGIDLQPSEEMPADPYIQERQLAKRVHVSQTPPADDKLRRFLEYDGKILKFNAIWDDRDTEYGEIRYYDVLYFLSDDTIAVKENYERNSGRDPCPQLLRKTKLPKIWTDRPLDYPSIFLELSDAEVTEYYQPKDLIVGETIFVLGRGMLLYDCDSFTKNYFQKVLCITQPPAIPVKPKEKPPHPKEMPPHDGIGSLEDSLQNTLTVLPKPPKKDVMKQVLNANKYLRYQMMFDVVHPEDSIRRFLLLYSLSDSSCSIHEPPIRNSGIIGGKYLRSEMLIKPGSDPLNPEFYSPADFYIGATITIFTQRFIIIGADLFVYRYMQTNPEKFPCEVIGNIRNFMFLKGHLNEDISDKIDENKESAKVAEREAIGKEIHVQKTEMDKCLEVMKIGGANYDPNYEIRKKAELLAEYEKSIEHTSRIPPHGIKPVNNECLYQVEIGDVTSSVCKEIEGPSIAPKHIDTPEEAMKKYYDNILDKHKDVCLNAKPVECDPQPLIASNEYSDNVPDLRPKPIMVQPVAYPKDACQIKSVRFADDSKRCDQDRFDLCNNKAHKDHCNCTMYEQCK